MKWQKNRGRNKPTSVKASHLMAEKHLILKNLSFDGEIPDFKVSLLMVAKHQFKVWKPMYFNYRNFI